MPYRTAKSVIGSIYAKPSFAKVYPPDQNITKMNGANRQKYFFANFSIYVVNHIMFLRSKISD